MFNKLYVKTKKFIKENFIFLIVLTIIYLTLTFPLPYYIYNGGGILSLEDRIEIENKELKQDINLSYVNQLKGNVGTYLLSYIIPHWDKEKIEDTEYDYEEELYRNKIMLEESINNATINAYKEAGKDYEVIGEKVLVTYIFKEAKTDLKVGDQIIKVNDMIIHSADEFMEIINSSEIDSTNGDISIGKDERISVLKQNHNEYDEYGVIETVIMGNQKLYSIMKEKDAIYMKENFSDEDGIRAGELENEFAAMNGWQAESDAAILLSGLGINNELQEKYMSELKDSDKVKVLLAQALFGEPDVLLLDEPTNGLDIEAKIWLEEFLINFNNTILVVSHDRHFLNKVCTHMVDIDFEKITMFVGNYDFWYESSQLLLKQMKESNKKKEEKIKELQDFIRRFSANASKSKQATSRKKSLEKIQLDEIRPSSRKYPYIHFDVDRPLGKEVITIKQLSKSIDGKEVINNLNLTIDNTDKIAFVGTNELAKTTLFKILVGELEPDKGDIKLGTTVSMSYFPKNHDSYFKCDETLVDWLRNYSTEKEETFVRGFLGRMLFSGEEALKKVNVLSGGEKVRLMMAKSMLHKGNLLIMDEPTNHLDIESITALNNGMKDFPHTILFASHDHQLISTIANRIIEFKSDGKIIDKRMSYDEYLELNTKNK